MAESFLSTGRNRLKGSRLRVGMGNENKDEGATPALRIGRLDTAAGVRRELGRLYRVARRNAGGKVTAQDAARLSMILQNITRSLEVEELERRLRAVEERIGGAK